MALGVAPAIIRVTKPTWNMKQRLAAATLAGEAAEDGPGAVAADRRRDFGGGGGGSGVTSAAVKTKKLG